MAGDLSKKTVAALLVIAIVLSVTGTWLALTLEQPVIVLGPQSGEGGGKVSLNVGFESNEPLVSEGGGQVNFKVS